MSGWRPIETAPRDGTYIVLAGMTVEGDSPYRWTVDHPMVGKWGHDEEWGDGWIMYEGRLSFVMGFAATRWLALPDDDNAEVQP